MRSHAIQVPDWFSRSVIYQINPRTFSAEGTISAVTRTLPELARLGFSLMYLCPIFESDATEDEANWSERQKKSGTKNPKNPYRIRDYFKIDPEYGSMEDLRTFVDLAHQLGMHVMLDLVYLHIGPSAPILKQHSEFAQQDANGNIILSPWHFPYLDFHSKGLREYLWSNMSYYIGELDVDGFRCDVGDGVPLDFWVEGRRRIQAIKPDAVLLNEGRNPDSLRYAFDAMYCFSWHESIRAVMERHQPVSYLRQVYDETAADLPEGGLLMRDMDNHDTVTDWGGRTEEICGHAGMELILAMNYTLDGIPMVYCGNEIGDTANINMFANRFYPGFYNATDRSIVSEPYSLRRQTVIRVLNSLRQKSMVLQNGKTKWLCSDDETGLIIFRRTYENETVFFRGNISGKTNIVDSIPGVVLLSSNGQSENQIEPMGYQIILQYHK